MFLLTSLLKMATNIFHMSEDVRKIVPLMFNRTEETVNQDVNILKEWIKTQPHLTEIMDDAKIKNFLYLNKCSIERTKYKIDMYYTIKSLIPELYDDSNPKSPNMKHFMEVTYCCVFPKPLEDLYRVHYVKIKEPNKLAAREMVMQFRNITEVRLQEDCMVGDIIIFDMMTITLNDMTKLTPSLMKKGFVNYEQVFSMRLKAWYFVNSPPYITRLMTVFKSVLKPKIFDRIHVHQDCAILNQLFSKDVVPKDYGGEGPTVEELNDMMKLKLAEYQDRFDLFDTFRVDESLRPAKLNNDEILGYYGNFKKINVD